jgi:hypothetical protein
VLGAAALREIPAATNLSGIMTQGHASPFPVMGE